MPRAFAIEDVRSYMTYGPPPPWRPGGRTRGPDVLVADRFSGSFTGTEATTLDGGDGNDTLIGEIGGERLLSGREQDHDEDGDPDEPEQQEDADEPPPPSARSS